MMAATDVRFSPDAYAAEILRVLRESGSATEEECAALRAFLIA